MNAEITEALHSIRDRRRDARSRELAGTGARKLFTSRTLAVFLVLGAAFLESDPGRRADHSEGEHRARNQSCDDSGSPLQSGCVPEVAVITGVQEAAAACCDKT